MSITNEQLVEHVSNMTVLDLANLVKELEEKFVNLSTRNVKDIVEASGAIIELHD